jgi:plastocyanin
MLAAVAAGAPVVVTQNGRAFHPGQIVLHAGDTLEIINDDGELIHHAYVASDSFSFDSGDQEPGSKTDVVFSVKGKFTVLCGIHPKMRLDVDVR